MVLKARKLPVAYDRIKEWLEYDGPEERPSAPKLWEEDKVIYERLVQLRTLFFQKAHNYHTALKMQMKTYGISEVTFNRDYHGLIYIFGDMMTESREFEKMRYKSIQESILQQCLANGDMKGATAAMSNLIKLGGHDREQGDAVPLEMLNPGAYVLMVSEEDKQLIRNALMSGDGVIDVDSMNKSAAMQVEDIEHEDVTPKAHAK
jgi:hypothetical protein